jgi:hypothetical protein
MVKYQFEIDDDDWRAWKNTVPRTKSLDERIRELIAADTDGRVREAEAGRQQSSGQPTDAASIKPETPQVTLPENVEETLRGEIAGSGELLDARVDAIMSMYSVLRERGQAEKDELLDAVDVDATGYASRASVWSNMVKGKDTLSALPGVEPPPTGRSEWRYIDG